MVGTKKLSRVLRCKHFDILVSCTPHNQHFHFWIRLFAGKIALSSKTTGQCSHLVHFGSCHNAIEYLMRDMMNYHCLWVFRRRVKRIGKHSPDFSMFRTRVHGCSDAELCRVPIQSTVGTTAFQDRWDKNTATHRAWYWRTVKQYILCHSGACR